MKGKFRKIATARISDPHSVASQTSRDGQNPILPYFCLIPNALALDAALFAACWQGMANGSFGMESSWIHGLLVALAVWLGYTADRLVDAVGMKQNAQTVRHRFAHRHGKSLLLAPTKPLVHQHATDYRHWLNLSPSDIVSFTGEIPPKQRSELWDGATIVVSTPQVIQNDLIGGRISLKDVVHCTFDECHRATGNYAYTYISERYVADASNPLSTGLSASPGNDIESILAIFLPRQTKLVLI